MEQGLQHYNPYFSLAGYRRLDTVNPFARFIMPLSQPIRFDTSFVTSITMRYVIGPYTYAKGGVPMLMIQGYDQYRRRQLFSWQQQTQ